MCKGFQLVVWSQHDHNGVQAFKNEHAVQNPASNRAMRANHLLSIGPSSQVRPAGPRSYLDFKVQNTVLTVLLLWCSSLFFGLNLRFRRKKPTFMPTWRQSCLLKNYGDGPEVLVSHWALGWCGWLPRCSINSCDMLHFRPSHANLSREQKTIGEINSEQVFLIRGNEGISEDVFFITKL